MESKPSKVEQAIKELQDAAIVTGHLEKRHSEIPKARDETLKAQQENLKALNELYSKQTKMLSTQAGATLTRRTSANSAAAPN